MTIDRKAWRALYRIIRETDITEQESYNLALAVFWQPPTIMPPDVPENVPDVPEQTVVKGFAGAGKTDNFSRPV